MNFFPHVVPGTANITIGGAIASDIHGKSHHKVGSFSNHLLEIKLLTSDGDLRVLHPDGESSQLFWATVGGMGLTGFIVEATINLRKVESEFVIVEEARVKDLKGLLEKLDEFDKKFLYTVAWIDLSGDFRGRGIVSGANHAIVEDFRKSSKRNASVHISKRKIKIHNLFGFNFINALTVRLFNVFWYRKPLGRRFQQIQNYMHPLDRLMNWNLLYGKKGFIQYQFALPLENSKVIYEVLEVLESAKVFSFLAVLKSFGVSSRALLGFPINGLTLAIDIPAGQKKLSGLINQLDEIILRADGRVYLTKDSSLSSDNLRRMYHSVEEWKLIKSGIDPSNLWQSDQGRRLNLC
jgi:decaprenylphospho-beta-D-ribofuranose 2-oxidase